MVSGNMMGLPTDSAIFAWERFRAAVAAESGEYQKAPDNRDLASAPALESNELICEASS